MGKQTDAAASAAEKLVRAAEKALAALPPELQRTVTARKLSGFGAKKGGEARAKKLSKKERSRIAHRGGKMRWGLDPDEPAMSKRRRRKSPAAA